VTAEGKPDMRTTAAKAYVAQSSCSGSSNSKPSRIDNIFNAKP